jgi:hypothetical protein
LLQDSKGGLTEQFMKSPWPQIAVFVQVVDGEQYWLQMALHDLRHQRDVEVEIVVLDRTSSGNLSVVQPAEDLTIVRLGPDVSAGEAHRAGLNHTRAKIIAWHMLGVRNLPSRLRAQWEQLDDDEGLAMVTTNLVLTDTDGRIVALADPKKALDAPTPLWQSGVMVRRAALARIGRSADLPVELFLYSRLKAHGRTGHIAEPFCVVPEPRFRSMMRQSIDEAEAIQEIHPPISPRPDVTVIASATGTTAGVRRMLAALATQDLPAARFEVILIDAGDIPGIRIALSGIDVPFHLDLIGAGERSLSAARNAALHRARGEVLVFMDGDLQPARDNLLRHLARHRDSGSPRSILGEVTLRQAAAQDSVSHLVQTTSISSIRPEMRPGTAYKGQAFSCANLSIKREHLLRIGGFDVVFSGHGAEEVELGLRLERALGMPVIFDPEIRASRRDQQGMRSVMARHRALGWCTQRMARKHDDLSILFGGRSGQPLAEFWSAIQEEVVDCADEVSMLIARIRSLCESEREAGQGPRHVDEVAPMLQRLCALEFGQGLLSARAGIPLQDLVSGT